MTAAEVRSTVSHEDSRTPTDVDDARGVMGRFAVVDIDMDDVGLSLEDQGVASFHQSFEDVLGALDTKAHQLASQ